MHRFVVSVAVVLIFCATSTAATFYFATDPFTGSTAPGTPGRQVVGGEPSITFDIATDVFQIDPTFFGVSDPLAFLSDFGASVPPSGVNLIVLQDTPDPFNAGIAADLIASQVTVPGPGFYIYFNSGLDLPRLVFSADLSDNTADLKILARMTNLFEQAGLDALPTFSEANFLFAPVPEPASGITAATALVAVCAFALRRRQ